MSYEEPTQWEICGVSYRTTTSKANDVASKIFSTLEWLNYAVAKDLVQHGTFDPTTPAGRELVSELVVAYRAAYRKALGIIREELGDEAA